VLCEDSVVTDLLKEMENILLTDCHCCCEGMQNWAKHTIDRSERLK
jgi:hypothetical protein